MTTGTGTAPVMTGQQRADFERDGYLLVRGALSAAEVDRYAGALAEVYEEEARAGRLGPGGAMHVLSGVPRDERLLDLLDHPAIFPLVWGVLGWDIYMYHSHLNVHPPLRAESVPVWRWHQDGGRQNLQIESAPRPLMSVRVAYWLSDLSAPGRGNLMVIPGSHLRNTLPRPEHPERGFDQPEGAVELLAEPGDAVFFDRRIWHARSDNRSEITRRAVFLGYTYRWVRPRDDLAAARSAPGYAALSPVRQQLLGGYSGAADHFWCLTPDEVPLRTLLAGQGLLDPALPAHR